MAGARDGHFKEVISPFLRTKMDAAANRFGRSSRQSLALQRQYVRSPLEDNIAPDERWRHYESEISYTFEGRKLVGLERLYRRTILIEPSTVCAAHCRWCLRGQYPVKTMGRDDIAHAARFIGSSGVRDDLREVLITGGDPLMSPGLLRYTLEQLAEHAPNITIVRIGTRVPFHQPDRIDDELCALLAGFPRMRIEIGVNVNHPVEFWPEAVRAVQRIQSAGVRVYNQHPLLKGVNDDLPTLVELYSLLREHDIEAHYLFHAIPMRGMSHHRTSLAKGLALATQLSSCGEFSGRAKPRYAVMSEVGKIVVYHGAILDHRTSDNALLLRSGYRLAERQKWNPGWTPPEGVLVDEDGYLLTWYLDGTDEVQEEPASKASWSSITAP